MDPPTPSSPTPIGDPASWLVLFVRNNDLGPPKFTNEVQHFVKVLPWDRLIRTSPLKNGVRWPTYVPRATPSAKSRQLWIARHRALLES